MNNLSEMLSLEFTTVCQFELLLGPVTSFPHLDKGDFTSAVSAPFAGRFMEQPVIFPRSQA